MESVATNLPLLRPLVWNRVGLSLPKHGVMKRGVETCNMRHIGKCGGRGVAWVEAVRIMKWSKFTEFHQLSESVARSNMRYEV